MTLVIQYLFCVGLALEMLYPREGSGGFPTHCIRPAPSTPNSFKNQLLDYTDVYCTIIIFCKNVEITVGY